MVITILSKDTDIYTYAASSPGFSILLAALTMPSTQKRREMPYGALFLACSLVRYVLTLPHNSSSLGKLRPQGV
jgi:hypothetical protein